MLFDFLLQIKADPTSHDVKKPDTAGHTGRSWRIPLQPQADGPHNAPRGGERKKSNGRPGGVES